MGNGTFLLHRWIWCEYIIIIGLVINGTCCSSIKCYINYVYNPIEPNLMFICSKQETQEYTKTVVRYCLDTLQTWFDAIGFIDEVNVKVDVFCFQVAFLLCFS